MMPATIAPELISSLAKALRKMSMSATEVLAQDVSSDQRFTAVMFGLCTSSAATVLEKLEAREVDLLAAMEATIIAIRDIPEAKHALAILEAAIRSPGGE